MQFHLIFINGVLIKYFSSTIINKFHFLFWVKIYIIIHSLLLYHYIIFYLISTLHRVKKKLKTRFHLMIFFIKVALNIHINRVQQIKHHWLFLQFQKHHDSLHLDQLTQVNIDHVQNSISTQIHFPHQNQLHQLHPISQQHQNQL